MLGMTKPGGRAGSTSSPSDSGAGSAGLDGFDSTLLTVRFLPTFDDFSPSLLAGLKFHGYFLEHRFDIKCTRFFLTHPFEFNQNRFLGSLFDKCENAK